MPSAGLPQEVTDCSCHHPRRFNELATKKKSEREAQIGTCQCLTYIFKNSCGFTALDMPEWREMIEQIDWWAKQSSQVAEKIWSADELETLPAGTKPMATHLWSPGGERGANMKCSRWSTQWSSIKAWERAIVNQIVWKVTLEKFLRDGWGRVQMVFSVHIDIILKWTEWNPGSQVVKVMSAVPTQREVIWTSGKTVRFDFIKKVSVFSPFQFQFLLSHLGTSCQKFTPAWHLCVKGLLIEKYQILLLLFHHADPFNNSSICKSVLLSSNSFWNHHLKQTFVLPKALTLLEEDYTGCFRNSISFRAHVCINTFIAKAKIMLNICNGQ